VLNPTASASITVAVTLNPGWGQEPAQRRRISRGRGPMAAVGGDGRRPPQQEVACQRRAPQLSGAVIVSYGSRARALDRSVHCPALGRRVVYADWLEHGAHDALEFAGSSAALLLAGPRQTRRMWCGIQAWRSRFELTSAVPLNAGCMSATVVPTHEAELGHVGAHPGAPTRGVAQPRCVVEPRPRHYSCCSRQSTAI